jgi:hypothetical protein
MTKLFLRKLSSLVSDRLPSSLQRTATLIGINRRNSKMQGNVSHIIKSLE